MLRTELSALLAREMAARKLSVSSLAERASVAYETARSAVRGLSSPSAENVDKLLKAIGYRLTATPIDPHENSDAPDPKDDASGEASA